MTVATGTIVTPSCSYGSPNTRFTVSVSRTWSKRSLGFMETSSAYGYGMVFPMGGTANR